MRAAERSYAEALALAQRIGDVPAQIELHAALAQLAFYRCDWEQVGRSNDASAELAEREGLIGKLCSALHAAGIAAVARRRLGGLGAAVSSCPRARRAGWLV